ncbi:MULTISPECIES: hypothetical protein [Glutamicibacter]|uniref:hypothetical protein n=1 Tax=Glutamicibacter TaxID=1742989 RepID=UPI000EF0A51A|nr:hypothetical protein [Glutamicibacter sp.]HCJ55454.1 hypothetical protein [Glutamicibacter sp.]
MAGSTFDGIVYPEATDYIKDSAVPSKLASDLRTQAVTTQEAINRNGTRIQQVASNDATQKANAVVGIANTAVTVAGEAKGDAENAIQRVAALEAAGELNPESPTDGQTANLLGNPETLTHGALVSALLDEAKASGALRGALSDMFENEFSKGAQDWVANYGERVKLPTHQPLSEDGQVVHPSVVYVPEGVGGYKWWMAYTPYASGNDAYEDPCVVASMDGNNWVVPAGFSNPLDDAPGGSRFNSDTNIVFHDGKLHVFWRYADTRPEVWKITIYYRTSTDGINWSARQVAHEASMDSYRLMAPAFQYFDGKWHMWAVNNADSNRPFLYMTSSSLSASGWSAPTVCSLPVQEGYDRWHISVKRSGGQLLGIMNDSEKGGNGGRNANIYLITSSDGINWEKGRTPLVPRVGPEHNTMYAATLEVRGDAIDIWYSAIQQTPSPGTWYVFKATAFKTRPRQTGVSLSGFATTEAVIPANGGKQTVEVTFPPGYFKTTPVVTATPDNARAVISLSTTYPVTKDGFTLNLFNWTSAQASRTTVSWIAIESGA